MIVSLKQVMWVALAGTLLFPGWACTPKEPEGPPRTSSEEALRLLQPDAEVPREVALANTLRKYRDEGRPAPLPTPSISEAMAYKVREELLKPDLEAQGPVVGYKAALTSQAARDAVGADTPVWGILLKGMLHNDGAKLPDTFGARPVAEADLLVRVTDSGIHDATSRLDVLRHLDMVFPFIELADLTYAEGNMPGKAALIAANAGARMGVTGFGTRLSATPEWVDRLGGFSVVVTDNLGAEIGRGHAASLMGHPLDVVRWLAAELKAKGITLKEGDLLSLGSLTTPIKPIQELRLRAVYTGLSPDGPQAVGMQFALRAPQVVKPVDPEEPETGW
ncbi:MAG: fumarylacetoacetate hydrolase [Nitrospirota bacterium]|nr:fumarylacetoacetate hydrolase [Nitrospirota bacterium]